MADERVIGSLADLAEVQGMPSERTLRKLIRDNPDFPIVSIGKNGVAYEIDFEAAVTWIRSHEDKRREAERVQAEQRRQFALDLLGEDAAAAPASEGLSAAERKALLEEELVAIKVAERRGQLIRKDSVEEAISTALVVDGRRRGSFSARLGKRVDLSRDTIAAIDLMIDQDRRAFAADMRKIIETSDADAEAGADSPV